MSGAVAFADFSQQVIAAANDLAAERRTAMAHKGRHQRSAKGSVVHGQCLARRDIATGDEVQTVEPRVRIAGVIDRSPHVWIVAPEDVETQVASEQEVDGLVATLHAAAQQGYDWVTSPFF